MQFKSAPEVEQLVWQLKLADWYRAVNRTKINDLFNGNPPYPDELAQQNNVEVNVNPLSGTRIAHDARSQFANSILKPGKFFGCRTDGGPVHKRTQFNTTVTSLIAKPMKRSRCYFETMRGKFASLILHGIGPCSWDDRDKWCNRMLGIEDVLIPSNTLIDMENLPFFALYRSYTGAQLRKLTRGPHVDKAWNMKLVDYMVKWVDAEGQKLLGTTWPEVWSPEKMAERVKGDGGVYASDAIPTIDCYDFYFWDDTGKQAGWRRRIVLDAYGSPGIGMAQGQIPTKGANRYGDEAKGFLFDSGDRVYAEHLSELISFQFADLSAVAPFRYHSVRSLGYLIWAVCHLQNRLYCKIQEATFESLMQYFRVKSMDDVERALKIELVHRGFIDENTSFVPQAERWQTDARLAELAFGHNENIINRNSSSFVQPQESGGGNSVEKKHLQVLAEMNAMTNLVSAALMQYNKYQEFEFIEMKRRFMRKDSRDPEVREFRLGALKAGVPEKLLVPEAWEVYVEQVMGAGNKTLEMLIAQQLLQMRNLYDPEPQRKILRDVTLAVTDSASMTEELVPDRPAVTHSTEDAQLAASTLLMGLPMSLKQGVSHVEYAKGLLAAMATVIQQIEAAGGMPTMDQIRGLLTLAGVDLQGKPTSQNGISQHIAVISQDPENKQLVRTFAKDLHNLLNVVKGFAQRLQEQEQAKQQQNGGLDPKDQAKIAGMLMTSKAKADNTKQSHAQRTAQKQISFEQQQRQKAQEHAQDLAQKAAETALDLQAEHTKNRLRSFED